MNHRSWALGVAALLIACAGCGGGNSPSTSINNQESPTKANDEMLKMYGAPKAETSQSTNAADEMRNMYNKR